MKGHIHSFETFGTVDGPGIRFVIFMMGCPLRCKFCHNPDTWTFKDSKIMETDEIVSYIRKYKNYYRNGGGVTISGGEPLVQMDFLIELTRKLKEEGFHVAVDTSGGTFNRNPETIAKFDELIKTVDLFMLDIKHIDNEEHIKLTGKPNTNILDFAHYLEEKKKQVWIRHVLVPGITAVDEYLFRLRDFIKTLSNVVHVEVLPYHRLGRSKYEKLGIEYPLGDLRVPTSEEVKRAKQIICLEKEN